MFSGASPCWTLLTLWFEFLKLWHQKSTCFVFIERNEDKGDDLGALGDGRRWRRGRWRHVDNNWDDALESTGSRFVAWLFVFFEFAFVVIVAVTLVAVVTRQGDHRHRGRWEVEESVRVLPRQNEGGLVEGVEVTRKAASADAVSSDVWNGDPDFVEAVTKVPINDLKFIFWTCSTWSYLSVFLPLQLRKPNRSCFQR